MARSIGVLFDVFFEPPKKLLHIFFNCPVELKFRLDPAVLPKVISLGGM